MGGNPSNNSNKQNPFIRLIRNSIGGGESIRIKLLDIENGELSLTPTGSSDSYSSDDDDDDTSNTHSSEDDVNGGDGDVGGGGGPYSRYLRPNFGFSHTANAGTTITPATRRSHRRRHNHPHVKRQRSQSCFVDLQTPTGDHFHTIPPHQHHQPTHMNPSFVTTTSSCTTATAMATTSNSTQPYSLLSSASSNHSSCDNFKICSDDEEQQQHPPPVQMRRRHSRRRSTSQRRRSRSRSGGKCFYLFSRRSFVIHYLEQNVLVRF